MTPDIILIVSGCVLLLIGLVGGGVTSKYGAVGKVDSNVARILCVVIGFVLIAVGIGLKLQPQISYSDGAAKQNAKPEPSVEPKPTPATEQKTDNDAKVPAPSTRTVPPIVQKATRSEAGLGQSANVERRGQAGQSAPITIPADPLNWLRHDWSYQVSRSDDTGSDERNTRLTIAKESDLLKFTDYFHLTIGSSFVKSCSVEVRGHLQQPTLVEGQVVVSFTGQKYAVSADCDGNDAWRTATSANGQIRKRADGDIEIFIENLGVDRVLTQTD